MRRIISLLLLAVVSAACADDVGDIDRTQANRVPKSYFTGEWIYRATVIDVPPTAGFTFIGEQTESEKIVWDIQQNYLLAYRAYEHIEGQEEFAARPGVPWQGAPIAAYAIESHFDVQREYNPSTGEQSNVIVENTSDRHWNDRAYMRVDWSQNLIADFNFVTSWVKQNPVAYFVESSDRANPDRPQIGENYIDVVNKLFVEPETDEFLSWWYGMPVPSCWLYESLDKDCVGQAIKVRHSFLKVADHTLAYEPKQYDDFAFDKFGYFRSDRFVHDPQRDLLEGKTRHLMNRFNIWVQSRRCIDPDGNEIDVASCKPEPRSDVQPWQKWQPAEQRPERVEGATLVTIPYREREVRPIVYHLNEDFPAELLPAARNVAEQWDRAFRDTVANAWSADGRATSIDEVPRMFVLCEQSPVSDGAAAGGLDLSRYHSGALRHPEFSDDRAFCGPDGTRAMIGDLRFNMIYWVPNPNDAGLLGYGPAAVDPETGEILSANAFVYGAAHETFATFGADVVSLLNGDSTLTDFSDGKYLLDYLKRNRENPGVYRTNPLERREAALRSKLRADRVKQAAKTGRAGLDYVSANEKRLKESKLSQLVLTDEMVAAMSNGRFRSAREIPASEREKFSVGSWKETGFLARQKKREDLLSRHNITAADFRDDAVLHRALGYKAAGKQFEEIRRELLAEIFVATTLHEVGHTVGLRHNFAASADPLNYFTDPSNPERDYWQLRKDEAVVAWPNGDPDNNPTNKLSMVPRFFLTGDPAEDEPLEAARRRNVEKGMFELQYASIMDYAHKFNGDLHGLGKYDLAAIRYGYGELVEAWDFQAPDGTAEKLYPNELHYTTIPETLKPDGATLEEQVAHITKRKVVRASDIKDPDDEVPYRFCSDEYAGATGWCHRFDSGGDMWESVDNNIQEYESYYWFYNFKRGRAKFGLDFWSYLGRIYYRHFDFLGTQFKQMTNEEFFIRGDQDCGSTRFEEAYPHYAGTDCGADQYLSAIESLNFFGRVLARPDVGTYGFNAKSGAYELNHDSTNGGAKPKDEVALGLGDARYADTYFSYERYGYDFYYKPMVIGSWWDKWLAVDALGDPWTYFIQNKATDSLEYVFNYRVIFPNLVNNMVGGYITESLSHYAPRIGADGSLQYRRIEPWAESYVEDEAGAKPINPAEQYTGRLVAAFDGLMYFTDNYDQDFTNSIKIFVKGMGEGQLPPDAEYVEVTDPVSRRTYVALKYQPMQIKYDRFGRPLKDSAGNFIYEPVPDFLPIGYEFLQRIQSRFANAPDDLHYELSFADIIRDAVHLYEYRE